MQIDVDNFDKNSTYNMEDDEDDKDEGMFSFQQQYKFTNLKQMFPDKPAINIGDQKDRSTVTSLTSGMLNAWKIIDQDKAERQTGDKQDG